MRYVRSACQGERKTKPAAPRSVRWNSSVRAVEPEVRSSTNSKRSSRSL